MNSREQAKKILPEHKSLYSVIKKCYKIYCDFVGPLHVLPNYLIIGAAKAGTTSLYEYLIKNPTVAPAMTKQIHYFDKYYNRKENWYKTAFTTKLKRNKIIKKYGKFATGEATPYYIYHPHVPRRVYELMPNVKLIVLLRNPIDRAYSRYNMELRNNNETLSFEEAIEEEPKRLEGEYEKMVNDENYYSYEYDAHSYLTNGVYTDQLERWFKYFPRKQFLIIKSEEFYSNPEQILDKVTDFLKLPSSEKNSLKIFRKGQYYRMKPETREKLVEFFKPHNERLYKLLGTDFGWDR